MTTPIEAIQERLVRAYGPRYADWDPLDELARLAVDPGTPPVERVELLKAISQFWHPKQKALTLGVSPGQGTGVLRVPMVQGEDWVAAAAAHRERVLAGAFSVESVPSDFL